MKYNKQNQIVLDMTDIFKKSEISNQNGTSTIMCTKTKNYILSVHNEVI
jgi:hypothetical protein